MSPFLLAAILVSDDIIYCIFSGLSSVLQSPISSKTGSSYDYTSDASSYRNSETIRDSSSFVRPGNQDNRPENRDNRPENQDNRPGNQDNRCFDVAASFIQTCNNVVAACLEVLLSIHSLGLLSIYSLGLVSIHSLGLLSIHSLGLVSIHSLGLVSIHSLGLVSTHSLGLVSTHTLVLYYNSWAYNQTVITILHDRFDFHSGFGISNIAVSPNNESRCPVMG